MERYHLVGTLHYLHYQTKQSESHYDHCYTSDTSADLHHHPISFHQQRKVIHFFLEVD